MARGLGAGSTAGSAEAVAQSAAGAGPAARVAGEPAPSLLAQPALAGVERGALRPPGPAARGRRARSAAVAGGGTLTDRWRRLELAGRRRGRLREAPAPERPWPAPPWKPAASRALPGGRRLRIAHGGAEERGQEGFDLGLSRSTFQNHADRDGIPAPPEGSRTTPFARGAGLSGGGAGSGSVARCRPGRRAWRRGGGSRNRPTDRRRRPSRRRRGPSARRELKPSRRENVRRHPIPELVLEDDRHPPDTDRAVKRGATLTRMGGAEPDQEVMLTRQPMLLHLLQDPRTTARRIPAWLPGTTGAVDSGSMHLPRGPGRVRQTGPPGSGPGSGRSMVPSGVQGRSGRPARWSSSSSRRRTQTALAVVVAGGLEAALHAEAPHPRRERRACRGGWRRADSGPRADHRERARVGRQRRPEEQRDRQQGEP